MPQCRRLVSWLQLFCRTCLFYRVERSTRPHITPADTSRPCSAPTQSDRFEFPFISVCVFPGEGCDWSDGTVDACVGDALGYSNVFDHDGEAHLTLVVESQVRSLSDQQEILYSTAL